jgi:hypothetical protein
MKVVLINLGSDGASMKKDLMEVRKKANLPENPWA